jgi:acyl-CoA synthetase (NDP forming)
LPLDESHPLHTVFHPKSVAIAGASATNPEAGWVARLRNSGFAGDIYPINPKATEISGLKAYPSIRDIPGPVEYAIFNIPARIAPQIMEDCVAKGVKVVHCYAAGFGETGKEEAKALEAQLAAIAKAGGVRVIGPNCMGIYCPRSGLTFNPDFPKEPGNVAFVSQSGAEAMRFVFLADDVGIRFSKVISYGNAIDLDAHDFLEYLAEDDETDVIACYTEGVSNGRRYLEAIKRCLRVKPVVILKAGLTESGAGAAVSHTASLAGSKAIWDAFFKQTGAISTNTMDDVCDVILALLNMSYPKGRRAALVGRGGGIGVIAADICERAGLKVPAFHPDTRNQLEKLIPEAGAGIRNPVETTYGMGGAAAFYAKGLDIVDADTETDFIIIQLAVDVYGGRASDLPQQVTKAAEVLCETLPRLTKPIAAAIYTGGHTHTIDAVIEARHKLLKAGVPVYPGVEAASRAISKLIGYRELTEKLRND